LPFIRTHQFSPFEIVEFKAYFQHVKSLAFEDRPDYDYLRRLFRELFFRKSFVFDNVFDWDILGISACNTVPHSHAGSTQDQSSVNQSNGHTNTASVGLTTNSVR
jgi:hypothetical protein